jgi:branched-chain amino acid transport system substrate-binding protein
MVIQMRIAAILVLLLVVGCAPRPLDITIPQPAPDLPGQAVFQDAQHAYETGNYAAALDGFNAFLNEAAGGRHADLALFRIASIYQLTGRDDDAMAVFGRLVREYPYSQLVGDAHVAMLKLLFDNERYPSVIAEGLRFLERRDAANVDVPLAMMVAEAYTALELPLNAAVLYYRAWNAADGDEEAGRAWSGLKKSVESLSADQIQQLIAQVSEKRAMGYLLYRLGMAFIMEEQYDDALDVLTAFVAQFPEHDDYQDAVDMIASLTERSRFTPYSIGCLLPLSGAYAVFGQRALDGIELAINHATQLDGDVPFRLVVRDSGSDDGMAQRAIDALEKEKVGAIIGPMATADVAAEAAQAKGIPILVFTQKEGVADIGNYVLRNFITPEMQVRSLVAYVTGVLGVRRFAILYPAENYGTRYMNLFWDQVIAQGGMVSALEAYDPSATDFADPIKKLAAIFYDRPHDLPVPTIDGAIANGELPGRRLLAPGADDDMVKRSGRIPWNRDTDEEDQPQPFVDFDAVFIPDAPKKAGLVIPQLAFYDIRDVYLLGTNLWNSTTLIDMAGSYMQNAIIVDGFFADSRATHVQQFVAEFKRIFDRSPGIIEALAYDSTLMVMQTMRETGTDSRRELKMALLQLHDFQGVTGRSGFNSNGEADKDLELLCIKQGRFVQVPTPDIPVRGEMQETTPVPGIN